MTRCLIYAAALATLLLACADARTLQQNVGPPAGYTACTPGKAGNDFCFKTLNNPGNNPYECVPLTYMFADGNYGPTDGACVDNLGYTYSYNFKQFTYDPADTTWGGAAQKSFASEYQCDDQTKFSNQGCTLSYTKSQTTSTSTTFTQSLALEADATFKVGGCALCPAEADTTFKISTNFGFQENFQNSSTSSFSASVVTNPPPGNCTVALFSLNVINDFTAAFTVAVDADCKELVAFSSQGPYYTVPCTDMEADLKRQKNFTGSIASIDQGYGFNKQAHLGLAGIQTVTFGTKVNSQVCDCTDTACINAARAKQATGGQTGMNAVKAANVNTAALPKGVPASQIGQAKPIADAQKTCTNCVTNKGAPAPGASKAAPAPKAAKSG